MNSLTLNHRDASRITAHNRRTVNARSKASVILLCVSFVPLLFGQVPPNRTQTKPPVNETRGVNRPQIGILVPRTSIVPLLFGMKRVEVARVLEPLRLQPKFSGPDDGIALEQDPAAGTKVPYGSGVTVTLGRMPGLVLRGPAAPAYAGSELTFSVAFAPPLPEGPKAIYHFTWGDGTPTESTAKAVVMHRFADPGARVVSVIWSLDDNVKIGSARVAVDVLPPPSDSGQTGTVVTRSSDVPLLFGMNRVQVAQVLASLRLRPAFSGIPNGVAVDQKPPAGTRVPFGSGVAVRLGELPRLVLSSSPAPASTASDLRLTVAFEPPLPAGTPVTYQYTWGDGTFTGPTGDWVFTHRFSEVSNRLVSVVATVNGRVKIEGRISVDVVAPPPSDTAQTATVSDTSTTTTQTATVSDTSTTTATATPVDTGTTSSSTETRSATSNTTPTTTTTAPNTTTGTVPTSDPSSNLLVWIGAAAVVLLLVVTFLLARVLRALNRKPSATQAQPKSPVAFNGGVRTIEYEIEHPELIRKGPAVGLRGGVRAEEGDDV